MNDRELLELAAKAAGMTVWRYSGTLGMCKMLDPSRPETTGSVGSNWNPLTDDGDALRLAVTLRIDVYTLPINAEAVTVTAKRRMRSDLLRQPNPTSSTEELARDPYAATRRAIVRAAAEIGRSMK